MTKSRGIRIPKGTRPRWVAENQGQHICECGCGQPIQLQPEHYPSTPRFIHGHNPTVTHRKEKPDRLPCECGCGVLANNGKRFITGHGSYGRRLSAESRAKIAASRIGAKNPMFGKPAVNRKPLLLATPCECGCGDLSTPGRRFISGHNGRGQRLSNYTGRYVHGTSGYAFVDVPRHPFAQKGYVAEHRIVIERNLIETAPGSDMLITLGDNLYLSPEIVVHHINGVKDDNRLENLHPMTRFEHTRLHHDQGDIHGH